MDTWHCTGPNYKVKLPNDQIVRRHADHTCARESDSEGVTPHKEVDDLPPIPVIQSTPANVPDSNELCHSQ